MTSVCAYRLAVGNRSRSPSQLLCMLLLPTLASTGHRRSKRVRAEQVQLQPVELVTTNLAQGWISIEGFAVREHKYLITSKTLVKVGDPHCTGYEREKEGHGWIWSQSTVHCRTFCSFQWWKWKQRKKERAGSNFVLLQETLVYLFSPGVCALPPTLDR